MKKILYILSISVLLPLLWASCTDDLNTQPLDPQSETPDKVYAKEENYMKALAKIYSTYAMSGQDGAGNSDIQGLDPGNTQMYRCWFNAQVLTTDEAINAWGNDPWPGDIIQMSWTTAQNEVFEGLYQRCMYTVALVNEFLTQTTDGKMSSRGIREDFWPTVHTYRDEAKALRALAYYMLIDTFGHPPFITEDNYSTQPSQLSRADLFDWIVGQLEELGESKDILEAQAIYGRVDKGFIYSLLSRMYLNAKVYTGTERYTECIAASKKVIDMGYSLAPNYENMFRADNNITSKSEIIFPIEFRGAKTESYGGSRYLIIASRGGYSSLAMTGLSESGWAGNSATEALVKKFEFSNPNYATTGDVASIKDKRGIFYSDGMALEITNWNNTFSTQGWKVHKYSNLKSDGLPGSSDTYPDTDIPFFRLGEIYLNYAEAVKSGGAGGDAALALKYVNELRARGYGDATGAISANDMTLSFLLDERAREMYWECTRRSDLIRHNLFTSGDYLWPFKGGLKDGTKVDDFKNLFPIPVSDISVNGSLSQNVGYK